MSIDVQETDLLADGTPETLAEAGADELVADELLVEEISIDGMCGVY